LPMARSPVSGQRQCVEIEDKELLELTADTATKKMEEKAIEMNADAIVGIRYSTCNLVDGAAEIIVYGTAVKCI
jgi:uncharacterized protein YbjQ (UPF0145 family)